MELRSVLRGPAVEAGLRVARSRADGADGDVRPLYRTLGAAGLLATPWPRAHGGRDADIAESVVLIEELARHGVPLSLHYITVHIVGSLVRQRGRPEQRDRLLGPMARGESYASILFTEPDTGSDLGSVACRARPDGDGWVVTGHKRYNLKTSYADHALTLVRTGEHGSRYRGLSLLLVPLDAPGLTVTRIPTMTGEHFHDVLFDEVRVGPDAVIGAPGEGWSLVNTLFAAERNGLDYYARGLHWLESAREALRDLPGDRTGGGLDEAAPDGTASIGMARLWARLDASRLLAGRALRTVSQGHADVASASLAKWHCSETAQQIAWWASETIDPTRLDPGRPERAVLLDAVQEAPSLTIAGGASEVLLELVAGARLRDDTGTDGGPR